MEGGNPKYYEELIGSYWEKERIGKKEGRLHELLGDSKGQDEYWGWKTIILLLAKKASKCSSPSPLYLQLTLSFPGRE